MIGLTKYLSTYWAKDGIRSNHYAQRGISTNPTILSLKINKLIPMSRMANPDDYKAQFNFYVQMLILYEGQP